MAGESVPLNYLPILLFIGIAVAFGAVSLLAGWFVRPSRPYRAKLTPYESGSPLFSDARIQFPMRYYIIAMLFVIFDIEIIFMIPWAVRYSVTRPAGTHRNARVSRHSSGRILVRLEEGGVGMGLMNEATVGRAHRARGIVAHARRAPTTIRLQLNRERK